ncbi:hypothetical protein P43SY_006588 [Pythium insidiosum]|uniref:Pseudouridine synthase I TruA alpha/beta domain-containing protein n=1 Tax=Pythium insidiosum TaxID=114742 RepID=A0AAD5Q4N0_PYTIN|nr:hypothetical protein P43SY_006588 [Pythium insidiosum]
MVAGYLGTGYHGVQLNKNVETIENELRKAILAAGAMRESNFADLSKIDWSRSSRTDKGVHAGCIVFSAKLLLDEHATVDPATGRVQALVDALNAELPPTIRIFSATRVNKRFSARRNCVLREYEYFLPLSFLEQSFLATSTADTSDVDLDAAVERFFAALREYEGIHDFHNFTKARSFFYRQRAQQKLRRVGGGAEASTGGDDDDDDVEDDGGERDDGSYTSAEYSDEASQYEDGLGTFRKELPRHRRAIYSCSGSLVRDFCGEPFLRVHIVGQAFLLHQIRCMVGGALAVATRGMSSDVFRAAIHTNRIVRVPIAPAEGLVLLSSSFGGKLHSVSLYEDFNTKLATEHKDVSHRVLLSAEEDAAMQRFREDVIYREVSRAWKSVTKVDRWHAYLARSFEANATLDAAEIAALLADAERAQHEKKRRQRSFVQQNRSNEIVDNKPRGVLPRQFTTNLCVRYSIPPGIFTNDVCRGIARHLRLGNVPIDADEQQIFEYIDKCGLQALANEGRMLRTGRHAPSSSGQRA